jgi:YebC/PmpR family DNA-binding regulatory protein
MAGHSKWAQIKRQKAVTDAKRSKIFSKLVRLISIEAKKAKGNLSDPALRQAIEKAKKENMPQDNIERAVKKATTSPEQMEEITYEAYGPGGVGIIIESLTSNRNKAAQEIKHVLSKNGFSLAGVGSVVWAFKKEGGEWFAQTSVPLENEEDLKSLDKLVEELEDNDEVQAVYTNAE